MWRDDVGSITFDYGAIGNPTNKFKGGWGASKIVAKRTAIDGIDGERFATERIPEIIANGKLKRITGRSESGRATVADKRGLVHLSLYRHGKRQTWLVTGYEFW